MKNAKHILVAPLDWGLGHTTRCVPLIRYIVSCGHSVLFAGNERQRQYITATFPGIETVHLDGYNVRYATMRLMFMTKITRQIPAILRKIKAEHEWLYKLVEQQKIDAIISDNRYGLHHPAVPCVIMTHQLQVKTGMGKIADGVFREFHYKYLDKFNECWVVDTEMNSLAAGLSHPRIMPKHAQYIGLLSQAVYKEVPEKYDLLVLLSGPEPQRTALAQKIWQQLKSYYGKAVFVEGSNDAATPAHIPKNITWLKQITGDQLNEALSGAGLVICRSGYSTIMDLVKLNKKAVLIPTPGQTEQEYLGVTLQRNGHFLCIPQYKFTIQQAAASAAQFSFKEYATTEFERYQAVVDTWLEQQEGS